MRMKEESGKAGLKFNIQKTRIMASSPITSWQIDEKNWKQGQFLFTWSSESLGMVTAESVNHVRAFAACGLQPVSLLCP